MRAFASIAFLLLAGLTGAALAEAPPASPDYSALPPPGPEVGRSFHSLLPSANTSRLDELFTRLKAAESGEESQGIERQIRTAWSSSGNATADLWIGWSESAAEAQDPAGALDYLDEALAVKPDFAEAYYRRATLHYQLGDISLAIDDLRTTLRIEPRHFSALWALSTILADMDQTDRALEILRRLQLLAPHFEGLEGAIETLVNGTHGRDV